MTAEQHLKAIRRQLKEYIYQHPQFRTTLTPWEETHRPGSGPPDDRRRRARRSGTDGRCRGAIAGMLGEALPANAELLIENGGDLFLRVQQPRTVAIYAGNSPFSWKTGIKIRPGEAWGAVYIIRNSWTRLQRRKSRCCCCSFPGPGVGGCGCHRLCQPDSKSNRFGTNHRFCRQIPGVKGVVLIFSEKMAVWGEIELVKL